MSRTKTLPDDAVLTHALALLQRAGPERLTFASLANATGLSGATLVQRFRNKTELQQRALLHAWDLLDLRTAELVSRMERSPEGACRLLVDLSKDYGDAHAYAQGLLLLREDVRDPILQARGLQWKKMLDQALGACFPHVSEDPEATGSLVTTHWQGALLWWAFDPQLPVHLYVEDAMRRFVGVLARRTSTAGEIRRGSS